MKKIFEARPDCDNAGPQDNTSSQDTADPQDTAEVR